MNKVSDIQYKVIQNDSEKGSSKMTINIKGNSINNIIINNYKKINHNNKTNNYKTI